MPVRPSHLKIDQVTLRYIGPSSAAFRPDPDEDGLSVYRHDELTRMGLGPRQVVVAGRGPAVVAGLDDSAVSAQGLQVVEDPLPVPPDISPAHALIIGWGPTPSRVRTQARTLATAAVCVFPNSDWHDSALEATAG